LYLSVSQVAKRLSIGKSTVWRWVAQGKFPKPRKFSSMTTRWALVDVETWEQEKEDIDEE
jgi:prophage regulatory protein